ncbi:acetyl-CoA synthetase-like protein [Dentipellis sp. KUC8613]|nr:acetyl-CoA synthetase-like protein [Dentipellis sp. KUC8613]
MANALKPCPIPLYDILLPDVYVAIEALEPDRLFARAMDGDDDAAPVDTITWRKLLHDARHAASQLLSSGAQPRQAGAPAPRPAGFLLDSNYLYYVYEVAALLLGWSVVLLSTRNSKAAFEHLIRVSKAEILVVDDSHMHIADDLKAEFPELRIVKVTDQYADGMVPYSRPTPSAEQIQADMDLPAVYLHSSGSTGQPKLIPISHRRLLSGARAGFGDLYVGDTLYGPLPLGHGLGYCMYILYPLGSGVVPVFLATKYPLTADSVIRHLKRLPQCIAFLPPAILEDVVAAGDAAMRTLAERTKRMIYAGAPLRKAAGETLVDHGVKLITSYGMTEVNSIAVMDVASENLREDWVYIRFHDNHDMLFIPVDGDNELREMVVAPGRDAVPAVFNHENPKGFATGDLWSPHPTIEGLWKHAGRKDSVIALSNGLKVNTKEIETLLLEDHQISRLVTFGAGRFLIGAILLPAQPPASPDAFIDAIWPTIERINGAVPKHAKLLREMLLVASPNKPFVLTDKNSVKTKDTLALYADEIEQAYANLETDASSDVPIPQTFDAPSLRAFVKELISLVVGRADVEDDANLFENGVDSLQAIRIRSALLGIVRRTTTADAPVSPLVVYENPTITQLTAYLQSRATGGDGQQSLEERCARIDALVEKYSTGFAEHKVGVAGAGKNTDEDEDSAEKAYVVTGTTGGLGSHVLTALLHRKGVKKVYCLNRPASGISPAQKQLNTFAFYGIPATLLEENKARVELLDVDLSRSDLGLKPEVLEEIRSSVTHIVHTAWQLNFNLIVDDFARVHIAGVRHLLDLALSSQRATPPSFLFISSIGVAGYFVSSFVPEEPIANPATVAHQNGYSQAKFVAERIIDRAARETGLRASVVRCGQLSGSTASGAWNETEYIPILLRSSFATGTFPEGLPDIRWVPTDIAGEIVVDLSLHRPVAAPPQAQYWHIENPETTAWTEVVRRVAEHGKGAVRLTPAQDWLEALRQMSVRRAGDDGTGGGAVPEAVRLLDFYTKYAAAGEGEPQTVLDTQKTVSVSPRLAFGSVVPWLDKYVQAVVAA